MNTNPLQQVPIRMQVTIAIILSVVISSKLQSQVLVHEEPHHRPVFQNEKIRMLNVFLKPGDTTLYHIHQTPSLFIFFSTTSTGSQLKGGTPSTGRSTPGSVRFENLSHPHVRTHRVWNIDTIPFHVMDIEFLRDSGFKQGPLTHSQLKLEVNVPWLRAYKLNLAPNGQFSLDRSTSPSVLVCIDPVSAEFEQQQVTERKKLSRGDFQWLKVNQSFSLKNLGASNARFVMVELPNR